MHTEISPFLQFSIALAIILFTAKLAGYLSTRLGQPGVLGELIIGLLLGPSLLNLAHWSPIANEFIEEFIYELGEIGVLLLMFLAGLELHIKDLARNTRVAAYAGTLGVVVPVGLGYILGQLTGMPGDHALFLGLTLGATSVSISAQTLMELKMLRSRVGLGLLGAAVFDDVLVILLLSVVLALQKGGSGLGSFLSILVWMLLFIGLSVGFGLWLLPRLTESLRRLPISQGSVTLAILVLLVYGLAAELVGGMAAITGAFIAGLMFARTPEKAHIESGMVTLTYGLFAPIFFVSIGLSIDLHAVQPSALWLLLAVSVVAIGGKLLGAGLGARLGRFSWRESWQLGAGMISRGEVGLIVAREGLKDGLLTAESISAIIGMILITTLITPPLLRLLFARDGKTAPSPAQPL